MNKQIIWLTVAVIASAAAFSRADPATAADAPAPNAEKAPIRASAKLLAHQKRYASPSLLRITDRVTLAYAYDYSNYAYIEGDDGVILIDAGWFPGQAKRSIADYRKTVDKPIVAVIYTHMHVDHTGGLSAILDGQTADIPIYGPAGWNEGPTSFYDVTSPEVFRRGYMQMGIALKRGNGGTVGVGIGKSPTPEGLPALIPPTIEVASEQEFSISGVKIRLIPSAGDVKQNLLVYLPGEQTLFPGDVPTSGVFPSVETVRFEKDRDPLAIYDTLQKIGRLDPENMIQGHGRPVIGREKVRAVVRDTGDIIKFVVDQVDRYYLNGFSADQLIDRIELPQALQENPDLQPHYHRMEWILKTMFLKRGGFVDDAMDYVTLTEGEEAHRFVDLLGGKKKVVKLARKALDAEDPRWSARLATIVLNVDPDHRVAKRIRQKAFIKIAETTQSGNERNYMFSTIGEENGELDFRLLGRKLFYSRISLLPASKALSLMTSRFRAEAANETTLSVRVDIQDNAPSSHCLAVRNNTLFVDDVFSICDTAHVSLSRNTLDKLSARMIDIETAVNQGDIQIHAGRKELEELARLLD